MKNLNDISSVVTVESIVTKSVTQNVTQNVTQVTNENNNQFVFSSAMYQTMPARHSSARSRDRDQVRLASWPSGTLFKLR